MQANAKVVVLGCDYIQMCLQDDSSTPAENKSWAAPSMRAREWSMSIYDYIEWSWTVCGTIPCGDELEYDHESTGRILVYAPTSLAEPVGPPSNGDGEEGDGGNGHDDEAPDNDQEADGNDAEETMDEDSTHLAFEAGVEPTGTIEDAVEEIPTAHAAIATPKREMNGDDRHSEDKTLN